MNLNLLRFESYLGHEFVQANVVVSIDVIFVKKNICLFSCRKYSQYTQSAVKVFSCEHQLLFGRINSFKVLSHCAHDFHETAVIAPCVRCKSGVQCPLHLFNSVLPVQGSSSRINARSNVINKGRKEKITFKFRVPTSEL